MQQTPISSETLARWSYTQTEWQDYVSFVLADRRKTYKSVRNWSVCIIVAAFLLMIFFGLNGYWSIPGQIIWRQEFWGPILGVAIIAFVILASMGAAVLFYREKDRKVKLLPNGEVLITLNSVVTEGSTFSWEFENNASPRFDAVERKTAATGEGKNIEILQFKCSIRLRYRENIFERIPIPSGKAAEAEQIIARLSAEKKRFAR